MRDGVQAEELGDNRRAGLVGDRSAVGHRTPQRMNRRRAIVTSPRTGRCSQGGQNFCLTIRSSRFEPTCHVIRSDIKVRPTGGYSMALSARNHLSGVIEEIAYGSIMCHVVVRVGDNLIESVITKRSAEDLALKKGDQVTAVVKATEVMIAKP
jgi:molybdopterin-binding protein